MVRHQVRPARIGLFGGTFDPVHFGHLRPAVELAEAYSLDTLYLLPNHRPAHRSPARASTDHRIAMLELAIEGADALAIDAREALREKPSYTFDTLTEIHAEQPQATLLFFMGLDAFAKYDTWHHWEEILQLANLVVVDRPDAEHSDFSTGLLARQQKSSGHSIVNGQCGVIEQCNVTQLSISATEIRRRMANELTVRFLLPDAVSEYIVGNSLYRTPSLS
ncbi:MAG: nicotinate-nucleotide adenylyltransferase [Granulosicoccus sp.]